MLSQKEETSKPPHPAKLKTFGLLVMSVSGLISSFTGVRLILVLGLLIGLFCFGWDAQKNGRLKQFAWMSVVYLLLFAVLIYLQFKGLPWD